MRVGPWRAVMVAGLLAGVAACATVPPAPPVVTAPRYPEYPTPVVPAALESSESTIAGHDTAWLRLQSGDLPGARRDFTDVLRRVPTFYPSMTGLGFAWLAGEEFGAALDSFEAALDLNPDYAPAWHGAAEAQVGLDLPAEAIASLERLASLDPGREDVLSRIALLRLRQVQRLVAGGRAAREAGRLDEAITDLRRALELSPSSAVILRELALVEVLRGDYGSAETHVRQAMEFDPLDPEAIAVLGTALESQERYDEAAEAFERAMGLEPRPEWRDRADRLRTMGRMAALPAEMSALEEAPSVTRAQAAALIALRLEAVIASAPSRVEEVATDIRGHWAAGWILPVTRAGVMEIYPNHTFLPSSAMQRRDLAQVVTALVRLAAVGQPAELAAWIGVRPAFADLPTTNFGYDAAALAVSSGAMASAEGNRFDPTGLVTGRALLAAVVRIEEIARR